MKHAIYLAALLSFAAHATPPVPGNNGGGNGGCGVSQQTNGCTPKAPKAPKITSTAASSASVSSASTGSVQSSTVIGGNSATGGSGGNVAGSGNAYVSSERSAPPVSVGAPSQPLTSCRLGFSGGGSNTSGALGFGLVLGNDSTCLVGAKLAVMERVGGFSADERRQVACEIEGMDKLATCKSIAEKSPQVARVEPLLP